LEFLFGLLVILTVRVALSNPPRVRKPEEIIILFLSVTVKHCFDEWLTDESFDQQGVQKRRRQDKELDSRG
jgi:hypothetical protein